MESDDAGRINPALLRSIEGKKRELDRFRPLAPEIVRKLNEQFSLEWTYNSNAIEGNTLTLQEASQICGKSQEYLSYLSRIGKLSAVKIGRNWKTTREAIMDYSKRKEK